MVATKSFKNTQFCGSFCRLALVKETARAVVNSFVFLEFMSKKNETMKRVFFVLFVNSFFLFYGIHKNRQHESGQRPQKNNIHKVIKNVLQFCY